MPPQQPEPASSEEDSLPLDHSHILLTSFSSFLTVAIHNILYYRNIYPPATFLSTKAYNLPVHQNRHPKVCAWIRDAVDAVAAQLATGHVSRVAVVIHAPSNHPSHPQTPPSPNPNPPNTPQQQPPIPPAHTTTTTAAPTNTSNTSSSSSSSSSSKNMRDFARVLARDARSEEARERHLGADAGNPGLGWPDLDEQLRGALRRMAAVAEGMGPLLPFSFGGSDGGGGNGGGNGGRDRGHPQAWIPSEPNLQPKGRGREVAGDDIGGVRTRPIRAVEAGPLFFECWVEESKAKEVLMKMAEDQSQGSTQPF
ncbi:hypothetical protein B0I37DRAFT_442775 [Chaetomium sp. MPI-CAGE-AT-0009]|nr:hypothetical protein B0I37DRAFT_442775 [Chaetomium sp. MPI-CAGE-AT-0009]